MSPLEPFKVGKPLMENLFTLEECGIMGNLVVVKFNHPIKLFTFHMVEKSTRTNKDMKYWFLRTGMYDIKDKFQSSVDIN